MACPIIFSFSHWKFSKPFVARKMKIHCIRDRFPEGYKQRKATNCTPATQCLEGNFNLKFSTTETPLWEVKALGELGFAVSIGVYPWASFVQSPAHSPAIGPTGQDRPSHSESKQLMGIHLQLEESNLKYFKILK